MRPSTFTDAILSVLFGLPLLKKTGPQICSLWVGAVGGLSAFLLSVHLAWTDQEESLYGCFLLFVHIYRWLLLLGLTGQAVTRGSSLTRPVLRFADVPCYVQEYTWNFHV